MPTIKEYLEGIEHKTGVVTKVVLQKKRRDRVSVFIDDEFAFGLADEVAMQHGLRKGIHVDPKFLLTLERDEELSACKRVAIRYLSYRMRSSTEVRKRLAKEGARQEVISAVLLQLAESRLIDDAAFAKAYARDAVAGKKWGPHRIATALRRVGIKDAHLAEALDEVKYMLDDEDIVMDLARKRWNQLSGVEDHRKRKKRLYDYLARRGFDFDDVRRVIDEIA